MKIGNKIILWLVIVQISLVIGVGVCFSQEFTGDKTIDAAIKQVMHGNVDSNIIRTLENGLLKNSKYRNDANAKGILAGAYGLMSVKQRYDKSFASKADKMAAEAYALDKNSVAAKMAYAANKAFSLNAADRKMAIGLLNELKMKGETANAANFALGHALIREGKIDDGVNTLRGSNFSQAREIDNAEKANTHLKDYQKYELKVTPVKKAPIEIAPIEKAPLERVR